MYVPLSMAPQHAFDRGVEVTHKEFGNGIVLRWATTKGTNGTDFYLVEVPGGSQVWYIGDLRCQT